MRCNLPIKRSHAATITVLVTTILLVNWITNTYPNTAAASDVSIAAAPYKHSEDIAASGSREDERGSDKYDDQDGEDDASKTMSDSDDVTDTEKHRAVANSDLNKQFNLNDLDALDLGDLDDIDDDRDDVSDEIDDGEQSSKDKHKQRQLRPQPKGARTKEQTYVTNRINGFIREVSNCNQSLYDADEIQVHVRHCPVYRSP